MTPKERAAMQQALEALELFGIDDMTYIKSEKAITALREALAEQAEQEPVAWIEIERGIPMFVRFADKYKPNCDGFIPLYAAPVRTKDLTDDEIDRIWLKMPEKDEFEDVHWFARAVIAAAIRVRGEK